MNWGNAIVTRVLWNDDIAAKVKLRIKLPGDMEQTDNKIAWLSRVQALVPVETDGFDHLIAKDKLEKLDNVQKFLNPNTEFDSCGYADCNVFDLRVGTLLQFERKAYSTTESISSLLTANQQYSSTSQLQAGYCKSESLILSNRAGRSTWC